MFFQNYWIILIRKFGKKNQFDSVSSQSRAHPFLLGFWGKGQPSYFVYIYYLQSRRNFSKLTNRAVYYFFSISFAFSVRNILTFYHLKGKARRCCSNWIWWQPRTNSTSHMKFPQLPPCKCFSLIPLLELDLS